MAAGLGVGRAHHHIFLCVDAAEPKCAPPVEAAAAWAHLKRRLAELGLEGRVHASESLPCVMRTKAGCMRVCRGGPIAVVYPEGVWYAGITVPVMERIVVEHLAGGQPVGSHRIAGAPLRPFKA
ncbi:MAG: (2Fe-2S) ferredoxin domain-containing protein [Planctomycetota bacterium]|nr:(2Fe-2S) ferredoxin domain-containing protein [Planctomycetota bacterium]